MKKFLCMLCTLLLTLLAFAGCSLDNQTGENSNQLPNSPSYTSTNSSSQNTNDTSSTNSTNQASTATNNSQAPVQSSSQAAEQSRSQTASSSNSTETPIIPIPSGDIEKIDYFVKNASDVGTATENPGTANSSNALYADVPDSYVNVTDIKTGDFFASPQGTSSGSGTQNNPYDFKTALGKLEKGKTLFLLEGTYNFSSTITIGKSGTRSQYIKIFAYNNKRAVLDFSSMSENSSNRGVILKGNYVHIYGVDFKGAGDNGLNLGGNYDILDNCRFYNNRDSGFQISGSGSSFLAWPHDNLIRNCTSFNNSDTSGENADGFACKLTNGNNNTFDGCMAYSNSDDGWDLFSRDQNNGRTIILNCIAFANGKRLDGSGTAQGDCNGYKLGYNAFDSNNYVENSMAFDNYQSGFTANGNTGALTIKNCTAYNNARLNGGASNFRLYKSSYNGSKKTTINCLSLSTGSINDNYDGTVINSLLYSSKNYFIANAVNKTSSAFSSDGVQKSLSISSMVESTTSITPAANLHTVLRNPDNTINLGNYLKVKSNSEIYNLGTNNSQLGADLSKSNYFSAQGTIALINAIGTPSKTSASYTLIYKAAKSFNSLSAAEKNQVTNIAKLIAAINVYIA